MSAVELEEADWISSRFFRASSFDCQESYRSHWNADAQECSNDMVDQWNVERQSRGPLVQVLGFGFVYYNHEKDCGSVGFTDVLAKTFDSGNLIELPENGLSCVDEKDFRLLVALYENARQSYRSLGRKVSLSAPAVRERLKSLEKKGVLQGYWCYPDPSIFGREDVMVFFKGAWQRQDVLRALSAPDVAFVTWKLDGGLSIQTWPQNRSKSATELTSVLRVEPLGLSFTDPTPLRTLSPVDFEIIDALIDYPTVPLKELIEKTGLSSKTVRKHLRLLIREKAIFIMPRLGALADSGELVYHLAVTGRLRSNDLRRSLGDFYIISETQDPPMKYLLCRATDLADVTSRTQALRSISGVTSVVLTLNKELLTASDFMHKLVAEKTQEWKRARFENSTA